MYSRCFTRCKSPYVKNLQVYHKTSNLASSQFFFSSDAKLEIICNYINVVTEYKETHILRILYGAACSMSHIIILVYPATELQSYKHREKTNIIL